MGKFWRTAGTMLVVALGVVTMPGAAQADSGGGCSGSTVSSCISRSGNYVYPDFYLNAAPDYSRCHASMVLYINGNYKKSQGYDLTYQGHYGPISYNVDTYPNTYQRAQTKVEIYTCDWTLHMTVWSPNLYYTL